MTAEVLLEYENVVQGPDGVSYEARACGRERSDGLWEGWLEFVPLAGGDPLRTGRETTQPNHDDIHYWATGLTFGYLEGALLRVLTPAPRVKVREPRTRPFYDAPDDHSDTR